MISVSCHVLSKRGIHVNKETLAFYRPFSMTFHSSSSLSEHQTPITVDVQSGFSSGTCRINIKSLNVQNIKQNPSSEPQGAPQLVTNAKNIRQVKAWDSAGQ